MDENYNNSDKITIRVETSDDDYQDILIDWSKETVDLKKSIFEQLSIFTGIQVEEATEIRFKRNVHNGIVTCHVIKNMDFKKCGSPNYHLFGERPNNFARDGDCYRLQTVARFDLDLDYIYVRYDLLHQDLIDETGCNRNFCHQRGSRVFLNKLAQVFNSDIDSYLQDQPDRPRRPRLSESPQVTYITDEFFHAHCNKMTEILKDLNIGQYLHRYCVGSRIFNPYETLGLYPRLYWPNWG